MGNVIGMCGRYTHLLIWSQIVELYRLTLPDEPKELTPSYNVAPTHVMPIIRPARNGRELVMAGWGLVPFWLKLDQLGKQPYSTINARDDRVQTAPTYREPFKKRRCLVPASGWYEWQKIGQDEEASSFPAGDQAVRLRRRLGCLEWRRQSVHHQLLNRDYLTGT